ncbi:pyridoxal-dependent decarboxylase [Paractinoplanes toevensis]|uniref:Histidine decarboxylase n=1 Tax=Paractinoplanes toevensis TaxID=571911 RepID=A0A919W498_9ACTN|nr:pyridoxal-dependent decarboxylase [Actinoplanes toevensis]GIM95702.1 histidine decarboxylase [Actinoplanes toevensis]
MTTDLLSPHSPAATSTGELAELDPYLNQVLARITVADATNIGYPRAIDIDYAALAPFLRFMLNNPGEPHGPDPIYPLHTMDVERRVLTWFANLFGAERGWTGYLASGSTEGTLHSLRLARAKLIDPLVFYSRAAHYSVLKAARILGLPAIAVDAAPHGEMDYADLRVKAARTSSRAAIVVATIGTTMTEAIDSVPAIHGSLDDAGVARRWIHADAALGGAPAALTGRTDFHLTRGGADSIVTSGHKWWGTPITTAPTLTVHQPTGDSRPISYIGNADTTIAGSRSGLAAVVLAHALTRHSLAGQRRRVEQARAVAGYACRRLTAIGWPYWRNPDAVTVMLRPLPEPLTKKWPLPVDGGWSHVICMPGITTDHIDHLVTDLQGGS